MDHNSSADCIFLDFSKAFDKVCHKLLLLKLSKLNLDHHLLSWLHCYLSNRSQYVTANGYDSMPNPVHSGVPQGSVLGPLLFLIYINDLPNCVSCNIHLFADDCVIFRDISNPNDISLLQQDLTAISEWCDTWLMNLNINKCKVLRISRSNTVPPSTYYLNDVTLENVSSYKYLGLHITTQLTWSLHITSIINNANRMLGYLRRNFSSAPPSLKTLLYKSLVRSKLEYSASIWDPSAASLINAIELVQNNSARFITGNYSRTASITAIKNTLALPTLASRRKISRLSLFHKLYYDLPCLRGELLPPPTYVSSRIDHQHKIGLSSYRTNTCLHSFVPRTSAEWNHLPSDIVHIRDYSRFRTALCSFFEAQ